VTRSHPLLASAVGLADQSRKVSRFIDKKHIAVVIKIFAGEILSAKLELDVVIA